MNPLSTTWLLLLLVMPAACFSQSQISGQVQDGEGKPLPFANVLLLAAQDSALVKGMVANETGHYQLEKVAGGEYRLQVSMMGYQKGYSAPFSITSNQQSKEIPVLVLQPETQQLNAVTVVAQKPLFEQQPDRLVVNVQSSVTNAGSTALEVLERSPGVAVNGQNGDISLNGKEGVGVMINGKLSRLPASAVIEMLRGMNAANLDKIELIANPSARYDAEGAGGLINLVLKQNPDYGTNGSLSATAGYGYGEKWGTSFTLNHRTRKFTSFADYSFFRNRLRQWAILSRTYPEDGTLVNSQTISDRWPIVTNHTARAGFEYALSPKTTLGGLVSGYSNKWQIEAQNQSVYSSRPPAETPIRIDNLELNHWQHLMGNLNLIKTFRPGQELRADLDYLWYYNHNPTDYLHRSGGADGMTEATQLRKETPIRMGVFKLDYRQPIGKKISWEMGVKGNFSRFTNEVSVVDRQNGEWVTNTAFTQKHYLSEQIAAAYTSWQVQLNTATQLTAGLRYEYTRTDLDSDTQKGIVNRRYGNLFPNLLLTRDFSKNSSVQLSYGRRISRPAFNDLAPFVLLVGPDNFISGNPALQPALAHTARLQGRYKDLITALQYTYEKSSIMPFQPHFDSEKGAYVYSAENLKNTSTLTFSANLPWQVTSWWNMQNTLLASRQQARAAYLERPLQVTSYNFRFNTTQRFQLPRNFTLELSGYYQSPSLFGIYRHRALGVLNLGLQKKMKNQGGTLSLTWEDLFWTTPLRWNISLPEYNLQSQTVLKTAEPRVVKLTYFRPIGNQKLKAAPSRSTGSEEERKRVN